MGDQRRFQSIISTADGQVFEAELWASSVVDAARALAGQLDIEAVITNVHARHVNGE